MGGLNGKQDEEVPEKRLKGEFKGERKPRSLNRRLEGRTRENCGASTVFLVTGGRGGLFFCALSTG